ncbi:non-ribosomal peptide synthetase [Enterococcus plantarum]|uniref:non-ribosomal peptide synthetase n=1 Tax=Enterococcus plantarum TaxID=1077675 RepID=UPI001A8FB539|nr:non-ribosomal peptide synthetase [Enterococcus plantarum]MBO0468537.1 non-ribosomal peptide synthetase [Enterococcus plantarum]
MRNSFTNKIELQTAKDTNTITASNLSDVSIHSIQNRANDLPLNDYYFQHIVESNDNNFSSLLKKEKERTIGYSDKVRIILLEGKNDNFLILSSNRAKADLRLLSKVYKFLVEEIEMLVRDDSFKINEIVKGQLSWGIPSLALKNKKVTYKYLIKELQGKPLINFNLTNKTFLSLLAKTLKKYTSEKNLIHMINMTENNYIEQYVFFNEHGELIEQDLINNADEKECGIQLWVIDKNEKNKLNYVPFLSPVVPLSIILNKTDGIISSISLQSSDDAIEESVLIQFGDILLSYIEKCTKVTDMSITDKINSLTLPFIKEPKQVNKENLAKLLQEVMSSNKNNIALSDDNGDLTYQELDLLSNRVALNLSNSGVNVGDKVVVTMNQTNELIIMLIGIIRAGGVYIPIDPKYPSERISFILKDSKAQYLITSTPSQSLDNNFKELHDEKLLSNYHEKEQDSKLQVITDKSGYIIYTSGTTGVPKGVVVRSKNILTLFNATKERFTFGNHDVWTMFHSSSFDFSVWEMWGCLLSGGKLIVVSRENATSLYDFYELLKRQKVTVLNQTPSSFYALQNIDSENRESQLNSLRLIIFGGEALDQTKLKKWYSRYSATKCQLVNMYGITETTVHVTLKEIKKSEIKVKSNNVGLPLNGWGISIRNTEGNLCPLGVEGEIWVSGFGLSEGYLNRTELTKEKFVYDILTDRTWYKSGDLGRMRSDGSIDHLGRIDNQVKIRGYRIELDEIREQIENISGITDAAVIVSNSKDGEEGYDQIIAYYVSDTSYSNEQINNKLMRKLPSYMSISQSYQVENIPLTINGKIDKKELLKNHSSKSTDNINAQKNQGNNLVNIWEKILNQQIEEEDNFFECGGNSLLAVALLSELKQSLNAKLSLKDLYVYSSPKSMQNYIESLESERD